MWESRAIYRRFFNSPTGYGLRTSVSASGQCGVILFGKSRVLFRRIPNDHRDVSQPGRGQAIPRSNLHRHQQERAVARRGIVADYSASNHRMFRFERTQRRVPLTVRHNASYLINLFHCCRMHDT